MKTNSTKIFLLLSGIALLANVAFAADPADDGGSAASIRGDLFNDSDGDGVKDPGETLAQGVVVKLVNKKGEVVAQTTTNKKGVYHFQAVPDGKYELNFEFENTAVVRSERFKVDAKNQSIVFLSVPSSASGEKRYALRRAKDGVIIAGPASGGLGEGLGRLLLAPNSANLTGEEVSRYRP